MTATLQAGHTARYRAIGLLLLLLATVTAGCSSEAAAPTSPRPLTTQEAERLAVVRFTAFNAGTRAFTGTLADARTQTALTGWLNYTDHTGYALATPGPIEGQAGSGTPFLAQWNPTQIAQQPFPGNTPPLPVPTQGWTAGPLTASDSALATGLLVLISLSSDRPENPQLLAQSTATWIRHDTVNNTEVDVMTGPAAADGTPGGKLRYWVDNAGNLQKLELLLAGDRWSVITFTDAPDVTVPPFGTTG